jgi:DNA repair protein RadD
MINNNLIEYRDYQGEAINDTLNYWEKEDWRSPIIEAPTGSGKSIIVGGVVVEAMRRYQTKLRSVIIVPSKELCIQNAEKLEKLAPPGVSVDVYSASVGRKNALADIVCCTIGSIRSKAAEFGHRDIIGIDECHRVSPDGKGDYWEFIDGMITLKRKFRLFGLTATPYRGNGVWITDGKRPAFHGFSHRIKIMEMLERGFLSPLVIPGEEIRTRINTDGVEKSGYDFKIDQLAARTAKYLVTAADEAIHLAANRNKWIAFLPDVQTANDFAKILNAKGVPSGVVTGETPELEKLPPLFPPLFWENPPFC